jgi:predicted deacylase
VRIVPPDLWRWRKSATGIAHVHERDSGLPGPEVLVTALVHGNEFSGAIVLDAFLACGIRPKRGRITAAFCNVAAFERFDTAKPDASRFVDEDFNRVWSRERLDGRSDSAELRRARELRPYVDRCTHLLDLHSMHEPSPPLLITGVLPRNVEFARRLRCGGQIVMDEGHADGVRMRDYEGTGYPGSARIALLLEAGQHWETGSVAHAADVLMRFLVEAGSLLPDEVPGGWLLPDAMAQPPLEVTHRVVAASADFAFLGDFRGGEVIPRAGTAIAVDGGKATLTPYDDCVLVMPSVRQLRPGVTTVRLGRRVSGD